MSGVHSRPVRTPGAALGLAGVLVAAGALFAIRSFEPAFVARSVPTTVNRELSYQLCSLGVVAGLLVVLWTVAREQTRTFGRFGSIGAPVTPAPRIGLTPDEDETWVHVGVTFTVLITLVTALVVGGTQFRSLPDARRSLIFLPWIVLFAASNAIVEEVIFRLGVVASLAGRLRPSRVAIVSGTIFGGVHYFGVAPRGIAGLFMAGFIGWFLAKSVLETGGLFWAWTIHFVQDLVLFAFVLGTAT